MEKQTCYSCNEIFEYPGFKTIEGWVIDVCPKCGSPDISNFVTNGRIVKIELRNGQTKEGRIVREVSGAFTMQIENRLYTFRDNDVVKMEFPGTHREPILFDDE